MFTLPNYNLDSKLFEDDYTVVYQCAHNDTGENAIVKFYKRGYLLQQESVIVEDEFNFLQTTGEFGVFHSRKLIRNDEFTAIIYEYFDCVSLASYSKSNSFSSQDFLEIAIRICKVVQSFHKNRKYFYYLTIADIFYNPDTKEIKLLRSPVLSKDLNKNIDLIIETPYKKYCSPEFIAKNRKNIDGRSDLFSLGAIFYELINGEESLDNFYFGHYVADFPLIHSDNIDNKDVRMLNVLRAIISKLLSSNFNSRYPTPNYLLLDLRKVLEKYKNNDNFDDFRLNQYTINTELNLSTEFLGREQEFVKLEQFILESVHSKRMVFISGEVGSGKSSLIDQIYTINDIENYIIAKGKFYEYDQIAPYKAITDAFSGVISKLLSSSDEELTQWRQVFFEALGEYSKYIIDIIPDLEFILQLSDGNSEKNIDKRNIGEQETILNDSPSDLKNIIHQYFLKFINTLISTQYHLILVIEDIQWADDPSLSLLKYILNNEILHNFTFIATHRNGNDKNILKLSNFINDVKVCNKNIEFIKLPTFTQDDTALFLSKTLKCEKYKIEELANIIYKKTKGNPFFIREFVKKIYSNGLLKQIDIEESFEANTCEWVWDDKKIEAIFVTENVTELLKDNISKLSKDAYYLLKVIICFGGICYIESLAFILNKDTQELLNILDEAISLELVIKIDDKIKFSHSKIIEIINHSISDKDRENINYRISTTLIENTNLRLVQDYDFILPKFLYFAGNKLSDEEKLLLIESSIIASKKAKGIAAFDLSYDFLLNAKKFLPDGYWKEHYDLSFSFFTELVETYFVRSEWDRIFDTISILEKNSKSMLDIFSSHEFGIYSYIAQVKYKEAIKLGKKVANGLGFTLPMRSSKFRLMYKFIRAKFLIKKIGISNLSALPTLVNNKKIDAIKLLTDLGPAAYYLDSNLFASLILENIFLTIKNGLCPYSSVGFIGMGIFSLHFFKNVEQTIEFSKAAIVVLDRFKNKYLNYQVKYLFNAFITHWIEHYSIVKENIFDCYDLARRAGDLIFSSRSLNLYLYLDLASGENLASLSSHYYKNYSLIQSLNDKTSIVHYQIYYQSILNLLGNSSTPVVLQGDIFDEKKEFDNLLTSTLSDESIMLAYYHTKMLLSYIFENYDLGLNIYEHGNKYIKSAIGTIQSVEFYFYYALIIFSLLKYNKRRKKYFLKTLKKILRKFKTWSEFSPLNFRGKYLLLRANLNSLYQNRDLILTQYIHAIEESKKSGYINQIAIANEQVVQFLYEKKITSLAQLYLTDTLYYYKKWGALKKIEQLKEKYFELFNRKISAFHVDSEKLQIDIKMLIRISMLISEEVVVERFLKKLLKILLEISGADRAVVIVKTDGVFYNEADMTNSEVVIKRVPIAECHNLPISIVNYIERTHKSIVIDDAEVNKLYYRDTYIKSNEIQSIFCFPLLKQKELRGIIYLENRAAKYVFLPQKTEFLTLLSSQIIISLENSFMFEKIIDNEIEMQSQNDNLEDLNQKLESMNDQLTEVNNKILEVNEQLQKEKEIIFTTIQSLGEGVITVNRELKIEMINNIACELFSVSREEVLGSTLGSTMDKIAKINEDNREESFKNILNSVLENGNMAEWEVKYSDDKKKSLKDLSVRISGIVNEEDKTIKGAVIVINDITEKVKLEDELFKSSKIESLGVFAGGIAHDFNNLLTAIIGNISLMKLQINGQDNNIKLLNDAEKASIQAKELTYQLLSFSKGGIPVIKEVSLRNILREIPSFVMSGSNIKCEYNIEDKLWNVYVDKSQISQVIQNLVINARQATDSKKGKITISAKNVEIDDDNSQEIKGGFYLCIEITDQGTGISEDNLKKIFDPYFSTKKKGHGLGLAVTYSIVRKHRGYIFVDSTKGAGTKFTIFLPAIAKSSEMGKEEIIVDDNKCSAKILVLDDDALVLKLITKMLLKMGMVVDGVRTPKNTIDWYKKSLDNSQKYDLVILDLTIPGDIGGVEVAQQLLTFDSEAKIIATSGYSSDFDSESYKERGFIDFIKKPYTYEELKEAILHNIC